MTVRCRIYKTEIFFVSFIEKKKVTNNNRVFCTFLKIWPHSKPQPFFWVKWSTYCWLAAGVGFKKQRNKNIFLLTGQILMIKKQYVFLCFVKPNQRKPSTFFLGPNDLHRRMATDVVPRLPDHEGAQQPHLVRPFYQWAQVRKVLFPFKGAVSCFNTWPKSMANRFLNIRFLSSCFPKYIWNKSGTRQASKGFVFISIY